MYELSGNDAINLAYISWIDAPIVFMNGKDDKYQVYKNAQQA